MVRLEEIQAKMQELAGEDFDALVDALCRAGHARDEAEASVLDALAAGGLQVALEPEPVQESPDGVVDAAIDSDAAPALAVASAPRRSRLVAALLQFLVPGIGYVYAGRIGAALATWLVVFLAAGAYVVFVDAGSYALAMGMRFGLFLLITAMTVDVWRQLSHENQPSANKSQ